ncbi:MAG: filamentous hemagglutinin N-terminal domain-containing protein, partial [Acidithiobacillus sp.]|uniref:filamentous hemagglutinin N-terminal domain-containing protein n=1 Tax=Acidithiobacillus sp. TaxID=1872118 RepID=UPI003D0312E8
MHIKTKRRMNQIALAVGMALAAPVALAATVTATQVPGQGFVAYSGGATIAALLPTTSSETITINSSSNATPVILQWGGTAPSGATLLNSTGTAGFNIGSSASTTFNMASSGAAVLNIDVTSNPSQILGALNVTGPGSGTTNLFVANANGIVVGSTAVITAPGGLGLINADLSSTQAQAVYTTGVLPISFAGATNGVQILSGADLSGIGSGTLLVAGAGVVNVTGVQIGTGDSSHYAFSSSTTLDINGGIGG